tara:strand:- start:956 stop:1201 length:246 start_codon:yes stop_codon:yes gene_type:complete
MKNSNKVIAEFMGRYCSKSISPQPNPPEYHTSWDWLMPVVKKCLRMGDNTNEWDSLCEALTTCNEYEVYQAVVEFINQYNK